MELQEPDRTVLWKVTKMMSQRYRRVSFAAGKGRALVGWALLVGMVASSPQLAHATPPKFQEIEKIVHSHFANNRNYKDGDLISRADVEPIFNQLIARGVKFQDNEGLYSSFLPHNSFIVRELSTPAGRKFMRSVAGYPNVYDRLERLCWMPAGREMVRDLIGRPDGLEVLRSLTTPDGAKAVEKVMGGDVRGQNFDLPTGHIHTVDQLLARLREISQQTANNQSLGKK
jgi:hypothetical protein